jgi:hypothetical protein
MYHPFFAKSTSLVRQEYRAAVKIADHDSAKQVVVGVWAQSYIGAASTTALF